MIRKHSKKRDAVLQILQSTKSHPSAQWVYEQLKPQQKDISLGTVYRNIAVLRESGELVSVGVVDGEEHFDACVSPHPHFVCCRCGNIIDIPPDTPFAETQVLPRAETEASRKYGFEIDYRKTVFYGICAECGGQS